MKKTILLFSLLALTSSVWAKSWSDYPLAHAIRNECGCGQLHFADKYENFLGSIKKGEKFTVLNSKLQESLPLSSYVNYCLSPNEAKITDPDIKAWLDKFLHQYDSVVGTLN